MKESNLSELLNRRLALLGKREHLSLLEQCLHGIERECLRVTGEGRLAQTPHPEALGAALTHEQITTDYSESLLEFITPALPNPADTLSSLDKIHRFAYTKLGSEYLWSPSMPCPLPAEEDIPIAYYGTSNIGQLKYVYRKGLALRYGKTMQCIAGIHFFLLAFWAEMTAVSSWRDPSSMSLFTPTACCSTTLIVSSCCSISIAICRPHARRRAGQSRVRSLSSQSSATQSRDCPLPERTEAMKMVY